MVIKISARSPGETGIWICAATSLRSQECLGPADSYDSGTIHSEMRARLHDPHRYQIKLKAAILGADYMGEPDCQARDQSDMVNNCYGTVVCTAPAFAERDSQ